MERCLDCNSLLTKEEKVWWSAEQKSARTMLRGGVRFGHRQFALLFVLWRPGIPVRRQAPKFHVLHVHFRRSAIRDAHRQRQHAKAQEALVFRSQSLVTAVEINERLPFPPVCVYASAINTM